MPPEPSSSRISYAAFCLNTKIFSFKGRPSLLVLEHLERFDEADPHPIETTCQDPAFVVALHFDLWHVPIAPRDGVRHLRETTDRVDDREPEKNVQENEEKDEHPHQRCKHRPFGLACHL